MKKLGAFLVGLGLVAGVASAANVNSVNMVGYQNLSVPNGLVMMALNWNAVGGSSSIPINTLISGAGLTPGPGFFAADQLYVWDASLNGGTGGYKQYYLWTDDGLWYEFLNDNFPTTNVIQRGQGFWLRHSGSVTNVTVAGEVPVGGTNTVVFGAGSLHMIGSAYTASLPINGSNMTWTGNAGAGFFASDQLYVWYSSLNGGTGGYKQYYRWIDDGLWYEFLNDNFPTTDVIPLGQGAWFKNIGPASTTWTEVRPYTP